MHNDQRYSELVCDECCQTILHVPWESSQNPNWVQSISASFLCSDCSLHIGSLENYKVDLQQYQ